MVRPLAKQVFEAVLKLRRRDDLALFRKYSDYTMVPRLKFIDNVSLVRAIRVEGDIVECGTWRGGMSAAMAEALPGRGSALFDSFEGLPDTGENDGDAATSYLADARHDRLRASEGVARQTMTMSGQRFDIHRGWFADTLPGFCDADPRIAVLRLDGDWYESTMECLEYLFPNVVDGGIVLLDDYGHWEGCTRAVHDYLSRERRIEPIQQSRFGQVFVRKGIGYAVLA